MLEACADLELEVREWWAVAMKWRAFLVRKSRTMEEHDSKFREILIDDQNSLSSDYYYYYYYYYYYFCLLSFYFNYIPAFIYGEQFNVKIM